MRITAVVQGPISGPTHNVIKNIKDSNVFDKVICSCWNDEAEAIPGGFDKIVLNKKPDNPGIGNRNYQIVSSLGGVLHVETEYAVKFRSDQIISVASLQMMDKFYKKFKDSVDEQTLFVLGYFPTFPFHPRDHVFWGKTNFVKTLFDIPLDKQIKVDNPDYSRYTRAETYICSYYCASQYNQCIYSYIDNPCKYLVDFAPSRSEAMNLSNYLRTNDKAFKVFPRIELAWPKHGLANYHYSLTATIGEYWHDSNWQ